MFSEKAAALAEAQMEAAAAIVTGQAMHVTIRRCFAPYVVLKRRTGGTFNG